LLAKLEPHKATLARPDASEAERNAAKAALVDARTQLAQIGAALERHADELRAIDEGSEPHLATLEEAAWCYRFLSEFEIASAREKLADEARARRQEELNKLAVEGRAPAKAAVPHVPLSEVPLQPGEERVRALYEAMLATDAESRLVPIAKLEMAEVLALREEFDKAAELLQDALGGELTEELEPRLRIRLAACLIAQGDGETALAEVESIAADEINPASPEARFLAGEALIAAERFAEAAEMLKPFRDHGPLHNIAGISDRAMLRLGFAYEQQQQWEQARQAYETLWGRYAQSPWRLEARYGQAWCHQKLNQWDQAVNLYAEVARMTTAEVAARSQYNMGACRLAQQRWQEAADMLQLCAYTYDYPELCAQALVDAATALESLQKNDDAVRLLAQVGKDYSATQAAAPAAERLARLTAAP
jgi:cellulose synthase operon protein C